MGESPRNDDIIDEIGSKGFGHITEELEELHSQGVIPLEEEVPGAERVEESDNQFKLWGVWEIVFPSIDSHFGVVFVL